MRNFEFTQQLHQYSEWRGQLIQAIEQYAAWRQRYDLSDPQSSQALSALAHSLQSDRITLAFVAEFSRGKTELINALFFAETGLRLLPSSPGRTTMSPTELFWDEAGGSYIRLLNIETRLEELSLQDYKQQPNLWTHIPLDCDSPQQMQEAFKQLIATKQVSKELAEQLGLWDEQESAEQGIVNPESVEVPCWRHALISFPHPLLKQGLAILDTPGLNALGTEPELTLSMLPSAQAIVFVLAADTGVTKSDLVMWNSYVSNLNGQRRQGLAVIMNKIDAMWDDLAGDAGFDESIQKQIATSAATLSIEPELIFPLSAKQGLLAKVKGDLALLERSRLGALEHYLSSTILDQRRDLLKTIIDKDIGFIVNESIKLMEGKLHHAEQQLHEFQQVDFDNQELTAKLMAETRDRQNAYMTNIEVFHSSRKVFGTQAQILIDSLSKEKIDESIRRTRAEMLGSMTTIGMKQQMRKLFDELRDLLQDSVDSTEQTSRLIRAIHKKFQDEHGFKEIEPKLFSINQYRYELEELFLQGEAFRNSGKTTLTEQSVVVNKLYSTLIAKARTIVLAAQQDASSWANSVLTPLMHQIKDHKRQIESRLAMLRKITDSKESVGESIAQLEAELAVLSTQKHELQAIIAAMHMESVVV